MIILDEMITWNPVVANYGLQDEATGLKRDAATLKNDLVAFLENIAGYFPHSFVTEHILKNSTSLMDVWSIAEYSAKCRGWVGKNKSGGQF